MQNTLRADNHLFVQTGKPYRRFSPFKPTGFYKPCSNAMQVATKVITSWLPSITSRHYSADRGAAVEVKNTTRALTLASGSRLSVH